MIRKFEPFDLFAVTPQAAQVADAAQADVASAVLLAAQDSYTCEVSGVVHAVGGIAKVSEHRGYVWSIIGTDAGPHMLEIYRTALAMVNESQFKRLEMDVVCGFSQGIRFAEMLGFTCEALCMRGYKPDGSDASLFARVK